MRLHFISGLPRSGSTMLSAILRQNPRVQANITSPARDILAAVERETSRTNEASLLLSQQQKTKLYAGIFRALYEHPTHRVAFDTNRLWCAKLPLIAHLFPLAKVVACVRHVSWIMDSFERLFRGNPMELSGIYDFSPTTTVFSRCAKLASSDGVVGRSLDALREAYYGEHADRLMLIDYANFCANPQETMNKLYDFIDEPVFLHDFEHLKFDSPDFDDRLGAPGLHRVRPKVEYVARETVLPPMLFERYARDAFWLSDPQELPIRESA